MAAAAVSSKFSMKLLIDKNNQKVLFAEAGKDTVDFLFTFLSLPVGTVIRLLTKKEMVGSLANLYESIERLGEDYIQPSQNKDTLLKPKVSISTTNFPLLMIDDDSTSTPTTSAKRFYICRNCINSSSSGFSSGFSRNNWVTDSQGAACPNCRNTMSTEVMTYAPCGGKTAAQGASAAAAAAATATAAKVGFVKGVVTYMVMDDLVVKPMSTISSIAMLNKFNVKDVGALEEKMVDLDMTKALKLLKESLRSKAVLTRVFLSANKEEP